MHLWKEHANGQNMLQIKKTCFMNMLAVYTQTCPKYVQAKEGFGLLHTMNSIVTVTITTSNRFLVITADASYV